MKVNKKEVKFILSIVVFGALTLKNLWSPEVNKKDLPEKKTESVVLSAMTSSQSGEIRTGYDVIKVVDGDTVQVDIGGVKETVRLIGLDTPETVDPRKPVQCFGLEASKKAKEVLTGKKVSLEADSTQGDRDKYKRLLRYVFLEDGTNFNKIMIAEGYGHQYTYNKPYKYMEEFKQAETEAREAERGLWAGTNCLPTKVN